MSMLFEITGNAHAEIKSRTAKKVRCNKFGQRIAKVLRSYQKLSIIEATLSLFLSPCIV